jgi:hypothetical protein
MKPLSPTRRAALEQARTAETSQRPRLNDQISARFTSEERAAVEAMAVSRGLASGGSLLRMLFLLERERARKGGGA